MYKILKLICWLSLASYFYAPKAYNYTFITVCIGLFLASALITLKQNCKYDLIRFEFFFTICMFYTNYVYPLINYPINPYFSLFNIPFNEDYINKGTALSSIGMSFFYLGIYRRDVPKPVQIPFENMSFKVPKLQIFGLGTIFLPYMYSLYQRGVYTTEFETSFLNAILVYLVYFALFEHCYRYRNLNNLISFGTLFIRQPLMIFIILYTAIFLLIGSRTIPLRVCLLLLFSINALVVKIKKSIVLAIIVTGAVMMTLVGIARDGSALGNDAQILSIWDIGADLTINNRSLYTLMEYADKEGYSCGCTFLMNILSVAPFAQSIFLYVTGWNIDHISSASKNTSLGNQLVDLNGTGLGTNLIGDIYLAFGLIGVIFMMYYLGRLLYKIEDNILKGNLLSILIYALIFMEVVYYPRSGILSPLRAVAWVCALYFLFRIKTTRL